MSTRLIVASAASCALACATSPTLVTVPMLVESAPLPIAARDPVRADSDASTDLDGLLGAWSGRGWQPGKSWPITVTFEKAHGREVVAQARYADQRCTAEWQLHASDAQHWAGTETVKSNPLNRCAPGRITVEIIDDDQLNWRWVSTNGKDAASATLQRETTDEQP